jgi:hypothetical protein
MRIAQLVRVSDIFFSLVSKVLADEILTCVPKRLKKLVFKKSHFVSAIKVKKKNVSK